MSDDAVDERDGFLVQRHHPFAQQLAEWHFQPSALPGYLVDAVHFEVDEFADAQAGRSLQQQRVSGEPVRPALQRASQPAVQVRGEVARQRTRGLGDVGAEHQPPIRCFGPAPFGDVVEQAGDRQYSAAPFGDRDRCPGAGVDRFGGRGEIGLDVSAAIELGEAGQVRVDRGQVGGEVVEPAGGAGDGAAGVGGDQPVQVGDERRPQQVGSVAHALLEALPQQAGRVDRLPGKDAEVEQHLPGGARRCCSDGSEALRCGEPRWPRAGRRSRCRVRRRVADRSGSVAGRSRASRRRCGCVR